MPEEMPNIEGESHITPPEGSQKEAPKLFQPSWVMETPDEFTNLDPRLQLRAKQLHKAPGSVVTPNYLRKHYQEVEDQVLRGDIPEEDADPLMAKIAARIEELEFQKEAQTARTRTTEAKEQGQEEPSRPLEEMEARDKAATEELNKELREGRSLSSGAIQRLSRPSYLPDYETGGAGIPGLPDVREIGGKKLKNLFRERLRNLIEEQADQSFDQNWRLVYPLEMTIMSLYPKRGEPEIIPVEIENKEGEKEKEEVNLPSLRKELSVELQAYRNIHNYIYVHRRVGGVTPLIEAGALLSRDTIETLLHIPEVAETLKKFERIGDECCHAKQQAFEMSKRRKKGEDPSQKEKEWINTASQKEGEAKNLMSNSDSKEDGPFWARRIAGGLYSGLHESARQDMQVNESGDFFTDRLFHSPERAALQWNNWGRNPRPQLFEALDLKVTGFWQNVLEERLKTLKNIYRDNGKAKFREQCSLLEIDAEPTGNGNEVFVRSLSRARFEEISFSNEDNPCYLGVKSDEVRQANLTLDDADKIRKAIMDPRGFIDEPSMATLKKAYEVFKHLKGKKRSDWVRDVCHQVVLLYRDTVHPQKENAPSRSRKCPGQEIYPEMVPWTNNEVRNQLTRMTPPLTNEDEETLLKEFIGTRAQIRLKEDVGSAAKVGGSMLGEFVKALLGLK